MEYIVENTNVRQRKTEGFRRWFLNGFFDLIVWYDKPKGTIIGFQLCYSKNKREKEFTWTRRYTSTHRVSDIALERGISSMSTAILSGDVGPVPDNIITRFLRESTKVDKEITELVIQKIYDNKRKMVEP